jgi:glucokinase
VAETWIGAARGAQDVVFFAVGDHTTGGLVRGGAAVTGARGRAGSVAWLALNPVEREDYRKIGCLEAEVAAAGIVRRLIWRVKAGDRSRVQDTVKEDLAAITLQHVLDGARAGDGVSISVVRDTAKYLGMAAANLVVVSDPETLVLGGIMASAADLLLDLLKIEIGRRLPKPVMEALAIETATLGDDAAAIGAARLAAVALP